MSQVLDGVAYAHQQGVVHRDLSPSNIMISKNGVPRVMDFGISQMIGSESSAGQSIKGTLRYMSPEHFSTNQVIGPGSDVFALGLILFEMLTFTRAIDGENDFTIIFKIINEPAVAPSLMNPKVDVGLDSIVLKALQKEPEARFSDAKSMKEAIDTYLDLKQRGLQAVSGNKDSHSTVDFLLRRMQYKTDFPAFSQCVMEINKKTSSNSNASAKDLVNVILKDYSLTSKLLKLVNSAFYGQSRGGVTSIYQAVVILGFEQVRLAATSLMLFSHLGGESATEELRDAMIRSFMSGIIARDLAIRAGVRKTEVGFICSMFHNLGKNLTIYYFPEEYAEIKNLMAKNGLDMQSAARSVLGISLDELGVSVARAWKFPENIIYSMRRLPNGVMEKPNSTLDNLRHFSVFANELCEIAGSALPENKGTLLTRLVQRFEPGFCISETEVLTLLDSAISKIQRYAAILKVHPEQSPFIQSLLKFIETGDQSNSTNLCESQSLQTSESGEVEDMSGKHGASEAKNSYYIKELDGLPNPDPVAFPMRIWQGVRKLVHKVAWRQ
jgi:HD-like signal output (HDOD) protein